jgi:hypothetical protein
VTVEEPNSKPHVVLETTAQIDMLIETNQKAFETAEKNHTQLSVLSDKKISDAEQALAKEKNKDRKRSIALFIMIERTRKHTEEAIFEMLRQSMDDKHLLYSLIKTVAFVVDMLPDMDISGNEAKKRLEDHIEKYGETFEAMRLSWEQIKKERQKKEQEEQTEAKEKKESKSIYG